MKTTVLLAFCVTSGLLTLHCGSEPLSSPPSSTRTGGDPSDHPNEARITLVNLNPDGTFTQSDSYQSLQSYNAMVDARFAQLREWKRDGAPQALTIGAGYCGDWDALWLWDQQGASGSYPHLCCVVGSGTGYVANWHTGSMCAFTSGARSLASGGRTGWYGNNPAECYVEYAAYEPLYALDCDPSDIVHQD